MATTPTDEMTAEWCERAIKRGDSTDSIVKNGITYYRLFGERFAYTAKEAVKYAREYGYLATYKREKNSDYESGYLYIVYVARKVN